MADWSGLSIGCIHKMYGVNTAVSLGTSASNTIANTKGDWSEITASTDFDANSLTLYNQYTSIGDTLVDVAVGPVGSEQVIIENLLKSNFHNSVIQLDSPAIFPINIPEGSRIAVRIQCTGANTSYFTVAISKGGFLDQAFSKVLTIGANTADSGGLSIDPGGSANTKGAFVELTSSLSESINGLFLAFGGQNNSTRTNMLALCDIAVGPAGNEIVIVDNVPFGVNFAVDVLRHYTPIIPVSIPKGTRISARAQCNITDATDRLFDLILYGFL